MVVVFLCYAANSEAQTLKHVTHHMININNNNNNLGCRTCDRETVSSTSGRCTAG